MNYEILIGRQIIESCVLRTIQSFMWKDWNNH